MTRLRFSANLSLLWPELAPLDRFGAARAAGFDAVEMQYPQALDVSSLKRALRGAHQQLVMFNLEAGDQERGERGLLCLPGREGDFARTVTDGLRLARALGVSRLNVPAGIPDGVPGQVARATARDNLRRAGQLAHASGVTLMVEALNPVDRPGYLLGSAAEAVDLLRATGSSAARLQLDLYHEGISGNAVAAIARYRSRIEHVQLADHPGRHEPGSGLLPIAAMLRALERHGYGGFVGLEYTPSGRTEESFGWMADALGPD